MNVLGDRPSEIAAALSTAWLHLVLMPTEACNFRCAYCYEEFRHGPMPRYVENGVLRLIERHLPDLEDLALSWFGGEPLLAFDIMERILVGVRKLLSAYPHVGLLSDVTTNGSRLDTARFMRLVELGVRRYQISLDGPADHHDRTRVAAGGGTTFERIWATLLSIRDSPASVEVRIRVHVHRKNLDALPRFIARLADEFAQDSRFCLFLKTVSPLGGSNDVRFPFLPSARGQDSIAGLLASARELGLASTAGAEEGMCYASRANSFVVRADGRVNKCTVALEDPLNQVGRLDEDGVLHLDGARLSHWTRGLRSGSSAALHCPMRAL